jgi:xanthine/CO dehydrogenase XdhC/CoxF family maturation factor
MIGSKRKVIAIFKALQAEGLPAHLFDRVYAPIGLDIGAVTPEEIAVAVTAELIAFRRHATAALPHLSWFKGVQDADGNGEEDNSSPDCCEAKESVNHDEQLPDHSGH